jgi:hypothetical protein
MSNGTPPSPDSPWREVSFDHPTLMGILAPEMGAVQDAQGDVKGAIGRLREQVQASQREVQTAEGALISRQQAVVARIEELELSGREISFEEGTSLAEVRTAPRWGVGATYEVPTHKDLKGVSGTVARAIIRSRNPSSADELLLHVDVKGSRILPRMLRRYVVHADEAIFSIGEAPQPDDE